LADLGEEAEEGRCPEEVGPAGTAVEGAFSVVVGASGEVVPGGSACSGATPV
jgi:hypothetical protein